MSKPIVHYRGRATWYGLSALIELPLDHPNHLPGQSVSNTMEVITSKVVSFDEKTGRVETQNTIYVPEGTEEEPQKVA